MSNISENKMNVLSRLSRVMVAATLLAGSPASVYAAGALAPTLANRGGSKATAAATKILAPQANLGAALSKLPVYFEKNEGQIDPRVKFSARAAGYRLFLTSTEAVMVLAPAKAAKLKTPVTVSMKLKGANPNPSVKGLDLLPSHSSYMLGDDKSKWRTGVEHFGKVKVSSVYPGIDVVYYGVKGNTEHDYIVAPGANPGRILMGFSGAKSLRLDARGNLILNVEGGEVTYKAPALHQIVGGKTVSVQGRYLLVGDKHVRFVIGAYDRNLELVIDPAVSYSSFFGGTVDDRAFAIFVEASGKVYITGSTDSTGPGSIPGTAGKFQSANGGGTDAFAAEVSAGGLLLWASYMGGAGNEIGKGISVDTAGNVYITGSTTGNMPAKVQIGGGGGTDAFVAAFNPTGTALVYPTQQYGGAGTESGNGIAADSAGNVYVTGVTNSAAPDFVVVAAAQPILGGSSDAFLMKLNAAGAQQYSTFLGGAGTDTGNAVAITAGEAYITGQTTSNLPVFPVAPPANAAFSLTVTGASDAFIAKMNAAGAAWSYVTYVGGSGIDEGTGIAVSATGDAYITGQTFSADFPKVGFVTVGQTTLVGAPDAFVFKLRIGNGGGSNDGVYATYLGGSGDDQAKAITLDAAGQAYVAGITFSGDFPMVAPIAGGGTLVGAPEAFVTQIGPTGGTVGFSTYLGGSTMSGAQGIGLDSTGNIYATGWTNSSAATFPITNPFQAANAGGFDAFLTKFGAPSAPPAACTFSPTPATGYAAGGTTITLNGTSFNNVTSVKFGGVNATFAVNSSSNVIRTSPPAHGLAVVPLLVTTTIGSCQANYTYANSPTTGTGACGDDFFFPMPATGSRGNFAYCMAQPGSVKIKVYNAVGDVATTVDDTKTAGAQISEINTQRLAPGIYLYTTVKTYNDGTVARSGVKKFTVRH